MSTYILAFVVCDFVSVSTIGPNNLKVGSFTLIRLLLNNYNILIFEKIRVWTRNEYINNTDYMLDNLPKAYSFFQDYFNISEVVKKSDHLAAPDFNAGKQI